MYRLRFVIRVLIAGALLSSAAALAAPAASNPHEASPAVRVPATLAVRKDLGPPPAGISELKFRDVFKLPAGPKGFEPTEKLIGLDGKRVRIVGYMVHQEHAPAGAFLLSPLPVMLGDEDESLADDLPASAILVELAKARELSIPALPGLLQLTGTLHVGMHADASGRATAARLVLDAAPERAIKRVAKSVAAAKSPAPRKPR